jgi:hypothetical protein
VVIAGFVTLKVRSPNRILNEASLDMPVVKQVTRSDDGTLNDNFTDTANRNQKVVI